MCFIELLRKLKLYEVLITKTGLNVLKLELAHFTKIFLMFLLTLSDDIVIKF